jgi:uncharacterized protein (DUF58 family)
MIPAAPPRSTSFPLVPKRRVAALRVGELRSARRGSGAEVVATRPYRPGDDLRRIDRRTSARLSTARGEDVLVVREHRAEQAVPVVLAVDDAPTMDLCEEGLPWLRKPAAVAEAAAAIGASARRAGCPVRTVRGGLDETLSALALRPLPKGTFVFCVSDFLRLPAETRWRELGERGLDAVPVVVQDPLWEQSFPELDGVPVAVRDPAGGDAAALLTRREARGLRRRHEDRLASLLASLRGLELDPIVLSASDPGSVREAFGSWAADRKAARWRA